MRIGIVGGGQLGRMLAQAARPLGHQVTVLEPAEEVPAAGFADVIPAAYDDPAALLALARACDVVTCEFESVPASSLAAIEAAGVPVFPRPSAFATASDRLLEKSMFRALGLGTAPFADVVDDEGLERALREIELPAVLKTRRNGYDGKGQAVVRSPDEARAAFAAVGRVPCLLEGFVHFRRELSIVAVRGRDGAVATYDVVENVHREGILHTTTAPATGLRPEVAAAAAHAAHAVLTHLEYVGVMALELFEEDGGVRVNEMAPRVHNSGHCTIESAVTSQFENHVRAIVGSPLGSTALRAPATMVNLVGGVPALDAMLALDDVHVHLYDKRPKAGRKVGHVTSLGRDLPALLALVEACRVR